MGYNLFDNQIKDSIFDQFNVLFSERLFSICPFLLEFQIKVFPIDRLIDVNIITIEDADKQAYVSYIEKKSESVSETQAYIGKDEAAIDILNLTQEEQFACIAHEIGHIIIFFLSNQIHKGGQGEEIKADGYVCQLGLKESLRNVLNKLLTTDWYSEEIRHQLVNRLYWIEHFY